MLNVGTGSRRRRGRDVDRPWGAAASTRRRPAVSADSRTVSINVRDVGLDDDVTGSDDSKTYIEIYNQNLDTLEKTIEHVGPQTVDNASTCPEINHFCLGRVENHPRRSRGVKATRFRTGLHDGLG